MNVELSKDEMQQCAKWGTQRTEENRNRYNIAEYRTERFNLTPEQANRLAIMVEYAVLKWTGIEWGGNPRIWAPFVTSDLYAEYLGTPDIAGVIEVRRANNIGSPIPIRKKDVDAGAIVVQGFVAYHSQPFKGGPILVPNTVTLLGWADAVQDYATGLQPSWGNGSSRVAASRRPMADLDLSRVLVPVAPGVSA